MYGNFYHIKNGKFNFSSLNFEYKLILSNNKYFLRNLSTQAKNPQETNYYEILGVDKYANEREVKIAYKNLIKKKHPDISGKESHEDFLKLKNAYDVLGNPKTRKAYDQSLIQKEKIHLHKYYQNYEWIRQNRNYRNSQNGAKSADYEEFMNIFTEQIQWSSSGCDKEKYREHIIRKKKIKELSKLSPIWCLLLICAGLTSSSYMHYCNVARPLEYDEYGNLKTGRRPLSYARAKNEAKGNLNVVGDDDNDDDMHIYHAQRRYYRSQLKKSFYDVQQEIDQVPY